MESLQGLQAGVVQEILFHIESMTKELTKVAKDTKYLQKVHTEVLQEKDEAEKNLERVQCDIKHIYRVIPKILVVI
jgi:hypothetical protein